MNYDLVIQNSQIVTTGGIFPANVYCSNGKIDALTSVSDLRAADKVIDAKGRHLFPGLIEPHVHLGAFNGMESDMETETRSALGGGITTIMNFVTTKSNLRSEIQRQQQIIRDRALSNVGLIGVVMNQAHIDELESSVDLGVVSFKHYMSKPEFEKFLGWTYLDEGQILQSFSKIAKLGGMAMVHPENFEIIARKIEEVKASGRSDLAAWEEARPWYCEYDHMNTAVLLASIAQVPLYIVHVSTGSYRNVLDFARTRAVSLYLETNPAYLYFTKDDKELGILGKVNPPIREEAEREALWEGIRKGEIQCVGSDHIACNRKLRLGQGDIWSAIPGLHGLEMMLPIMLSEGFHRREISLERIVGAVTSNTAQIHRLRGKGRIEVGYDADFCLIDLNREVKVKQSMMHDASDYSLYEGRTFKGWPSMTILAGEVVMENGAVLKKPGTGRYLKGFSKSTQA
ncbi:MAG: amidohydrolase family protein [Thaumarchaeota archaeon]|nr:amidohydrolase family protein [Nitrososphaerota archaeon]